MVVGIPYLQAPAWRAIATFELLRLPVETEDEGMILQGTPCLITYPHRTSYYKESFIAQRG